MRFNLHTKSKPALLSAMMQALAGKKSAISFEGRLSHTELPNIPGASVRETANLKRATRSPELDFVVLPLTLETCPTIEKSIASKIAFSGQRGIIHVQIEIEGEIAFAAFDSFHPNTVIAGEQVQISLLNDLVSSGVLHSYQELTTTESKG